MQRGAIAALGAYAMWGFFPAFFPLLAPAAPAEIVAHRIVWSLVLLVVVLAATRRLGRLRGFSAQTWLRLLLAAAFVSGNWSLYVYTVNSDRVSEAALGYFINPLVSVLLGVLLFGERLLRAQAVAVGIAVLAVGVLTVGYGHFPYLSLGLALSFGLYGVSKKKLREPADLTLTAEVLVAAPFALAFLAWLHLAGSAALGHGTFVGHGVGHALLLVAGGVVTVAPLLLFGFAAQRIPLALLGMLQYITPTMQMLWAVLVVREQIDGTQWVGFALIVVAVALFSGSQFRTEWRARRAASPA